MFVALANSNVRRDQTVIKQFKDMKKTFQGEPILVKNPKTGKYINVAPLFECASELSDSKSDPQIDVIRDKIDDSIRFLNTCNASDTMQFNPSAIQEINYHLYMIMDMFEAMNNI